MKDIELLKDYLKTFNIVRNYYKLECEDFLKVVDDNLIELYKLVLDDIIEYCFVNKVYIKDFDDYKIVYFLGVRVYEKTNNISHFKAMLKILDILVKKDSNNFVNEDMIKKILLSLKNNTWKENYGKYGIYSMFKACSKHFA